MAIFWCAYNCMSFVYPVWTEQYCSTRTQSFVTLIRLYTAYCSFKAQLYRKERIWKGKGRVFSCEEVSASKTLLSTTSRPNPAIDSRSAHPSVACADIVSWGKVLRGFGCKYNIGCSCNHPSIQPPKEHFHGVCICLLLPRSVGLKGFSCLSFPSLPFHWTAFSGTSQKEHGVSFFSLWFCCVYNFSTFPRAGSI